MSVLFVQRFALGAAGGGPRILRQLVSDAPVPVASVYTSPRAAAPTSMPESQLAARPAFGRLETTRLGPWLDVVEPVLERRIERRLGRMAREVGARAIHAAAHGLDFWPALQVARRMRVPYLLTVHDDIGYVQRDSPLRGVALKRIARAWREANARFVITPELGEEYSRRYGRRDFVVVTDGVSRRATYGGERANGALDVYFMGSYHLSYRHNFDALVAGLERLRREQPARPISLTFRGGGIPFVPTTEVPVKVLPFAPEAVLEQEVRSASVLYLPLPFGAKHRDFVTLSLPTKLVTYLASARPVLYHGPGSAAVARLLEAHKAGIVVDSPDGDAVAAGLEAGLDDPAPIVAQALELASTQFDSDAIRRRFWDAVLEALR
jgi:glycosyltransferase involved in cell wall biosynthesis